MLVRLSGLIEFRELELALTIALNFTSLVNAGRLIREAAPSASSLGLRPRLLATGGWTRAWLAEKDRVLLLFHTCFHVALTGAFG